MSKSNFYLLCSFLGTFLISNHSFGQQTIAGSKLYNSKQILAASDIEGALIADRTRKIRLSSSPKGSGQKIEALHRMPTIYFLLKKNIISFGLNLKQLKRVT
jgi:hypothetical protein